MRIKLALLTMLFLNSCVSTRVVLNGNATWTRNAKPNYVDYFDYYWWGLSGTNTVNLQKVCLEQKPIQAEQIRTFEDGALTVISLGIYAPTTVRVWCGD